MGRDLNGGERRLWWWNDPVGQDEKADTGRDMVKTLLIWAAFIAALAVIVALIQAW